MGVEESSPAVLYYRELKTFASDVDVHYWGPEAGRVRVKLAERFHTLGMRFDLRVSCAMAAEWEKSSGSIEFGDRSVGFMEDFFSLGSCLEFNGASFPALLRGRRDALRNEASKDCVRDHLSRLLDAWNGRAVADGLALSPRHFKLLCFRAITHLSYLLCAEYGIEFSCLDGRFIDRLEECIPLAEARVIERGMALVNQARNVFQRTTLRHSEAAHPLDDWEFGEVDRMMRGQGVPDLGAELASLGRELDSIMSGRRGGDRPGGGPFATDGNADCAVPPEVAAQGFSDYVSGYIEIIKDNLIGWEPPGGQSTADVAPGS